VSAPNIRKPISIGESPKELFLVVSELCDAATKIQASFRGHMARKNPKEDEELSQEMKKLDAKVNHFSR